MARFMAPLLQALLHLMHLLGLFMLNGGRVSSNAYCGLAVNTHLTVLSTQEISKQDLH